MGTLLFRSYPALAQLDDAEARFLSTLVDDAVRGARRTGRHLTRFHAYRVQAWRDPLGGRLCAVTWRVDRGEAPVARDTAILFL